jgi:hypothetical protein
MPFTALTDQEEKTPENRLRLRGHHVLTTMP